MRKLVSAVAFQDLLTVGHPPLSRVLTFPCELFRSKLDRLFRRFRLLLSDWRLLRRLAPTTTKNCYVNREHFHDLVGGRLIHRFLVCGDPVL